MFIVFAPDVSLTALHGGGGWFGGHSIREMFVVLKDTSLSILKAVIAISLCTLFFELKTLRGSVFRSSVKSYVMVESKIFLSGQWPEPVP